MTDTRTRRAEALRLRLAARRGPYQDNGASPWYCPVTVGSGPGAAMLKLNVDTGARFNWVTSTDCGSGACTMPARRRFDAAASASFEPAGEAAVTIDFGYWGEMRARPGRDTVLLGAAPPPAGLGPGAGLRLGLYCASFYDGQQFRELNWDGGLAVPSGLSPDRHSTHLVEALLNAGLLAPEQALVSFLVDPASGTGHVEFGGYDAAAVEPDSCVELPFKPYRAGLDYIWTTPLRRWRVGAAEVARDVLLCHDTGSSHVKGDPRLLGEARRQVLLQRARAGAAPVLEFEVGRHRRDGRAARLRLAPEHYVQRIEAGSARGSESINLHPLAGYDGLVLVGSVLLDQLCTVYRFKVSGSPGRYRVAPDATLLFNKRGGPRVICS